MKQRKTQQKTRERWGLISKVIKENPGLNQKEIVYRILKEIGFINNESEYMNIKHGTWVTLYNRWRWHLRRMVKGGLLRSEKKKYGVVYYPK